MNKLKMFSKLRVIYYMCNNRVYSVSPITKLNLTENEGLTQENAQIKNIVDSIGKLNLLEVAELNVQLKKTFNLTDNIQPMIGVHASVGRSTTEDEDLVPVKIQTSFKVKMTQFDDKQKVALIKEIKNVMDGMNLVQAKKFVESVPTIVKDDVSKEEADRLKEILSKAGATIEIE